MHVFSPVESKSDVYFRRSGPENLDNTEKQIFSGISRISGFEQRKWTLNFYSTGQKTLILISSIQ